jgi:hypothetical protein
LHKQGRTGRRAYLDFRLTLRPAVFFADLLRPPGVFFARPAGRCLAAAGFRAGVALPFFFAEPGFFAAAFAPGFSAPASSFLLFPPAAFERPRAARFAGMLSARARSRSIASARLTWSGGLPRGSEALRLPSVT